MMMGMSSNMSISFACSVLEHGHVTESSHALVDSGSSHGDAGVVLYSYSFLQPSVFQAGLDKVFSQLTLVRPGGVYSGIGTLFSFPFPEAETSTSAASDEGIRAVRTNSQHVLLRTDIL